MDKRRWPITYNEIVDLFINPPRKLEIPRQTTVRRPTILFEHGSRHSG